ncbi:predicted protein [Naegleria gruberi]|uniref:Predicted protein n=1 Tax=Naegleria gruberi TaxID=5762 RepID=D2UZ73_NAEGR|nr:uncharacterized protein NAEGRDRAFT_61834 [Naegleria gruberi]EFC50103.1 predicted protein [Naegleria gruberi]|eukprot:XP_002682847.1 predicted protein [Naegleria gruberi strain NEG-M]
MTTSSPLPQLESSLLSMSLSNNTLPPVLTSLLRLEPLIVSYIEMTIVIIYLFITIGLLLFIIYFLLKLRRERGNLMKNQKRIIYGVLVMCCLEIVLLISRIIFDSLNISFGFRYQDYFSDRYGNNETIIEGFQTLLWFNNTLGLTPHEVGIPFEQIVIYAIAESLEICMALMNVQVMVIIVWFVTLVFIETFRLSSGTLRSKKLFYFTKIVTIFTGINSVGLVLITVFVSIVTILNRLAYAGDDLVTYGYILCFIIFVLEVTTQITMLVIAAYAVLKTISKIAEDQKKKRNSIVKVLILQSGLFGCFLFEAFAGGSGVAQQDPALSHFALGYSICNTLGILVFAFTALALYTPIHLLKENQGSDQNGTTSSIRSNNSKHIQSARNTSSTHKYSKNQSGGGDGVRCECGGFGRK